MRPSREVWEYLKNDKKMNTLDSAAATALVKKAGPLGTGRYCSPRHPTHFEPSFRELDGFL